MRNLFKINGEKKNDYLEFVEKKYESATYELYKKLLFKLDEFEEYKGIPSVNMTKLDFMEFLTSLNSSSLSVLYTYKSSINNYLLYVTDKQLFTIGLLELDKITQNDLAECINRRAESLQFITKNEYYNLIQDYKGNYQDKAVVVLLWHKVKGERNYSEIRNIKNTDINIENRLIKVDDRIIELDEIEINIIKEAMKEKYYTKISKINKIITTSEVPIMEGEYLIKTTAWRGNTDAISNQCAYSTFANRFSNYFTLALGRSELTGLKIYKSSIYYDMIKKYGRALTRGELEKYAEENNVKISLSNNYREQDIMCEKMMDEGVI
jgi:hypothetical protein